MAVSNCHEKTVIDSNIMLSVMLAIFACVHQITSKIILYPFAYKVNIFI